MQNTYKAAVIQLNASNNKMENLKKISACIDEAAAQGARLISLPEDMNLVGHNVGEGGNAETLSGLTADFLIGKAKEHGVYLHGGSFRTLTEGDSRSNNTTLMIAPDGRILAEYHKIHLFDITMADGTESGESKRTCPGKEIVVVDTELGRLGFSICYDIRFPELYRIMALKGAQVIFVPADFMAETGEAHWKVLLRARAIENSCYIIAANQCGEKKQYRSYGHSLVIDPWGNVVAEAGEQPEILYADIDLNVIEEVRKKIPALANRREDVYSMKER